MPYYHERKDQMGSRITQRPCNYAELSGRVCTRTNKGPEFNSHHRGNLQALQEVLGRESRQRLMSTECCFSFKLSDAVGGFGHTLRSKSLHCSCYLVLLPHHYIISRNMNIDRSWQYLGQKNEEPNLIYVPTKKVAGVTKASASLCYRLWALQRKKNRMGLKHRVWLE